MGLFSATAEDKKTSSSATAYIVKATPASHQPRAMPHKATAAKSGLQSSMVEIVSARPIETVSLKPTNTMTAAVNNPAKKKGPGFRPFRFGSLKNREKRPEVRSGRRPRIGNKRYDVPLFRGKNKNTRKSFTRPEVKQGGKSPHSTSKKASKPLSFIDSFTNTVASKQTGEDEDSKLSPNLPKSYAINPEPIVDKTGMPPTGLVTTLGGTLINNGLTTIHKTSVIGTYIKGQYAQVLLSTSRIFQSSTKVNPVRPPLATAQKTLPRFGTSENTKTVSLESLFTGQDEKHDGVDDPLLLKRRGPNQSNFNNDPFVDQLDESDLLESGSDLKPSFRQPGSGFRRKNKVAAGSGLRERNGKRPFVRRRPGSNSANRPKLLPNRKIKRKKQQQQVKPSITLPKPSPTKSTSSGNGAETINVEKSKIVDGIHTKWVEIATIRTMHSFRGNTRYNTFTKSITHTVEPTVLPAFQQSKSNDHDIYLDDELYADEIVSPAPLFENILESSKSVTTLSPLDIGASNLNALLKTVTESFITTETMLKTSVLPVVSSHLTHMNTLIQTYKITKIVNAVRTIPPNAAVDFIPENSLNEFNDKLLAEGTENDHSLLPGELEHGENNEIRVTPPPGFAQQEALAALLGGKTNSFGLNPAFNTGLAPQLSSGLTAVPESVTQATPNLSPEQIQLAYLQMMNPYMGGFNPFQPKVTVTSTPVTVTTDVTTTTTRVLRVIFNARPIYTTLTSTEVVRTTLTSYEPATITATPKVPFGGFQFPGMPFAAG